MRVSRWLVACVIVSALVLSACRTGSDFGTALLPDQKKQSPPSVDHPGSSEPVANEPVANKPVANASSETSASPETPLTGEQKDQMAKVENVTEVATYDMKNTCKKDAAGIVRTFDENGKKSVFRPFCDGKSLVSFSCVNNRASPSGSNCVNGCMIDERADAVCRKSPIPPRNPDPLRTSGTALDRTLGTSNG